MDRGYSGCFKGDLAKSTDSVSCCNHVIKCQTPVYADTREPMPPSTTVKCHHIPTEYCLSIMTTNTHHNSKAMFMYRIKKEFFLSEVGGGGLDPTRVARCGHEH